MINPSNNPPATPARWRRQMQTQTSLTARAALQIAANHGFSVRDGAWEKSLIRDSILQARNAELSDRPDGRRKSAIEYFDGYMAGTASDIRAEGLRGDAFHRDAYGD
jgi:hypothetical protein